jgi:hypothetical protein
MFPGEGRGPGACKAPTNANGLPPAWTSAFAGEL